MNNKTPEITQEGKPGPIPYFSTTLRDGVSVPLRQTLIIAGLWSGAAVIAVLLLAWLWSLITPKLGLNIPVPLDVLGFLAVAAFACTFFPIAIREWPKNRDHWEYIVEVGMGADLNQDGHIGDPQKPASSTLLVTLNKKTGDDQGVEYHELSYADRLPDLARDYLWMGKQLTYANFVDTGKFTRDEWEDLIQDWLNKSYVVKVNPRVKNSPITPTARGLELLQSLVAEGRRIEIETGKKQPMNLDYFVGPNGEKPTAPPYPTTNGRV